MPGADWLAVQLLVSLGQLAGGHLLERPDFCCDVLGHVAPFCGGSETRPLTRGPRNHTER